MIRSPSLSPRVYSFQIYHLVATAVMKVPFWAESEVPKAGCDCWPWVVDWLWLDDWAFRIWYSCSICSLLREKLMLLSLVHDVISVVTWWPLVSLLLLLVSFQLSYLPCNFQHLSRLWFDLWQWLHQRLPLFFWLQDSLQKFSGLRIEKTEFSVDIFTVPSITRLQVSSLQSSTKNVLNIW